MKLTTDTLAGKALDWAVSQAHQDGGLAPVAYSTDWQFGGPIIEQQRIELTMTNASGWRAQAPYNHDEDCESPAVYGYTPLVAAMRCYVASKLGDVVEVPDEIVHDALQRLAVALNEAG